MEIEPRVLTLWRVAHEAMQASPPRVALAVQALNAVEAMAVGNLNIRVANGVRLSKILLRHTHSAKTARVNLERVLPLVDARSPEYFEVLSLLCEADAIAAGQGAPSEVLLRPLSNAVAECLLAGHTAWLFHLSVKLALLHMRHGRVADAQQTVSRAITHAEQGGLTDEVLALQSVLLRILVVTSGVNEAAALLATLVPRLTTPPIKSSRNWHIARATCQAALIDLCSESLIVQYGPSLFPATPIAALDTTMGALDCLLSARWHRPSNLESSLALLSRARQPIRDALTKDRSPLERIDLLRLLADISGTAALAHLSASQIDDAHSELAVLQVALAALREQHAEKDGWLYIQALSLHRAGRIAEALQAWLDLATSTQRKDLAAFAALQLRLAAFIEGEQGKTAERLAQQCSPFVDIGATTSMAIDSFRSYVAACGDYLIGAQQTAKDKLGETLTKLRKRTYFEVIAPTLLMLGDIYEHLNEQHAREMVDKALALAHVQRMHLVYALCATKKRQSANAPPDQQLMLSTHISQALAAHDQGTERLIALQK